jgi:hypothetical protein
VQHRVQAPRLALPLQPVAARAQQAGKLRTIGFLGPNAHSAANEWVAALAQRLRDVET